MKDNRRHPRIDFHLPIQIMGYQGSHKIKNFSLGGLFVETEAFPRFGTGAEIDLVIKLPLEEDPIQISPRVAHVTGKGVGVEFVNLDPLHATAFESCFHVFRHTVPMPG